jgi:hypothetical protein
MRKIKYIEVYLLLNREEKGRAEELNLNLYQIKFKLE